MFNSNSTKAAVVAKYREIAKDYIANAEQIEDLQQKQRALEAMAQDCHAAGRLFGFNVADEAAAADHLVSSTPSAIEKPQLVLMKSKTIKELIVDEAQKAHPQPVRANALKKTLEELRGEELHDKTVGMTLYRLSKEGAVRRDGWDWFYVPQEDRKNMEDFSDIA